MTSALATAAYYTAPSTRRHWSDNQQPHASLKRDKILFTQVASNARRGGGPPAGSG